MVSYSLMTINQFVAYLRKTSEDLGRVVSDNVEEARKAFEILADRVDIEADKLEIDKDTQLRQLYYGWNIDLIDTDAKIRQLDVAIHQIQAMYSKAYEAVRYQLDKGFSEFDYKTHDIYADFRNGMLFIKTPLVFSSVNGTGGKYRVSNGPWGHSTAYKDGVICVIDKLLVQKPELASFFREAKKKLLCIAYAYQQYDKVMDTDNHDIKSVIDAATFRSITQDAGKYTSIYETTTTQKNIPMGTYVIVMKDDGDTAVSKNQILKLIEGWCNDRPDMVTKKSVKEIRAEQEGR